MIHATNTGQRTVPTERRPEDQKCAGRVTIPYVFRVPEQIRRVLGKFNITTHFKPDNSLKRHLVHPKDPVDDWRPADRRRLPSTRWTNGTLGRAPRSTGLSSRGCETSS